MGDVIEDHNLRNYSSGCTIYFRKFTGRPLLIKWIHDHTFWLEKVTCLNNGMIFKNDNFL